MFQSPMLRSQSSMRLPMYCGRPLDRGVGVEQPLAKLLHRDQPVVGDAADERRIAAPAVRVAVLIAARLDQEALLGEPADDLVGGLCRGEAVQPAVVVVEAPRLVDRREHGQIVDGASSKSSWPAPVAMWTMPVPSSSETSSQGIDAVLDPRARAELVERPSVAPADELLARSRSTKRSSGYRAAATHSPISRRPYSASGWTAAATLAGSVHGVVVHTTSDSPGRSSNGKRTKSDGSERSW